MSKRSMARAVHFEVEIKMGKLKGMPVPDHSQRKIKESYVIWKKHDDDYLKINIIQGNKLRFSSELHLSKRTGLITT